MSYPLHRPIWNYQDANLAFHMIPEWLPHYDGHHGELADRLAEIAVFRACQRWHELEDRKPCPTKFEPVLILKRDDPILLAPGMRVSNTNNGYIKRTRPSGRGSRFFADPIGLNPLGSMEAAKIFRQALVERFPIWPKLPLWQEPDQVLECMLTPIHRFRRDADLLARRTQPAPLANSASASQGQRRL